MAANRFSIIEKIREVANKVRDGKGRLLDSEGGWKDRGSEEMRSHKRYRTEKSERVKVVQLEEYIRKAKVEAYNGDKLDNNPTVWRENLYIVCMPAGHGKTTFARWVDGIDVDELVPGHQRWKYYDSVATMSRDGFGDNEWVRACNQTLDKMVFRKPTILFVHDPFTGKALGGIRIGTIRVNEDVVREANRGRSKVWHKAREISERLCESATSKHNWKVGSYESARVRLARIVTSVGVPVPRPYKFSGVSSTGYEYVEAYEEMREYWDVGDIPYMVRKVRQQEIPLCALIEYIDNVKAHGYTCPGVETSMGEYVALAREIAHREIATVAVDSGSTISRRMLIEQFQLEEHQDAMHILNGLPRSTDNFKMVLTMWWKTIGQELACAEELWALIDGLEETEWPVWMRHISAVAQGGRLGHGYVEDEDWYEIEEARKMERWSPARDEIAGGDVIGIDGLRYDERSILHNTEEVEVSMDMGILRGKAMFDSNIRELVRVVDQRLGVKSVVTLNQVQCVDTAFKMLVAYHGGDISSIKETEVWAKEIKYLEGRRQSVVCRVYTMLGAALSGAGDLVLGSCCAGELVERWMARTAMYLGGHVSLMCTKTHGFVHMYKVGVSGGKRSLGPLILHANGMEQVGAALLGNVMRKHGDWNTYDELVGRCRDKWFDRGGEGCEVLATIGMVRSLDTGEGIYLGDVVTIHRQGEAESSELIEMINKHLERCNIRIDDSGSEVYSGPDETAE